VERPYSLLFQEALYCTAYIVKISERLILILDFATDITEEADLMLRLTMNMGFFMPEKVSKLLLRRRY